MQKNNINFKITNIIKGLSHKKANQNILKYGNNEITYKKDLHFIFIFLLSLINPLSVLLFFASIIDLLATIFLEKSNNLTSFYVIITIIIINSCIETYSIMKNRKQINALKKLSYSYVRVTRDSEEITIPSHYLTVGDIVHLKIGEIVPADLIILKANNLKVDESSLTGESEAISKEPYNNKENTWFENNIINSGSIILSGSCIAMVHTVGLNTKIGHIAQNILENKSSKTPLQKTLFKLSIYISCLAFLIAIFIFLLLYFLELDLNTSKKIDNFLFAVTLAVAVVPESLPIIISIILSICSKEISKKNIILKNPNSIETLGVINYFCIDKTGTITKNHMQLNDIFIANKVIKKLNLDNKDHQVMLAIMYLCNDTKLSNVINNRIIGDPTEIALLEYIKNNKIKIDDFNKYKKIKSKLFSSKDKYMYTIYQNNKEYLYYFKGAYDIMLSKCKYIYQNNKLVELTNENRTSILKALNNFSSKSLRVLGMSYKIADNDNENPYENLIWIGATTIMDPIKKESYGLIKGLKQKDIQPLLITGDHPNIAGSIANQINITNNPQNVLTHKDVENLKYEKNLNILNKYQTFARVTPDNKLDIVNFIQSQNKIVAMTGDGINDASALSKANVGIAMGEIGSDIAKEAADVILLKDDLSDINFSINKGRIVYNQIQKVIKFILTSNLSEVFAVLFVAFVSKIPILHPSNVLWFNLIIETLLAIPLGMSMSNRKIIDKPRDVKKSILYEIKYQIFYIGIFKSIFIIGAFYLSHYLDPNNINSSITTSFLTLINIPILYVYILGSHKNNDNKKYLIISCIIAFLLNTLIIFTPKINYGLFHLSDLSWQDILIGYSFSIIPGIIMYVIKNYLQNLNWFKKIFKVK